MILTDIGITTPNTGLVVGGPVPITNGAFESANLQANFAFGSGGATVSAFVQTTLDGGNTWADVANFSFTTSSAISIFNLSNFAAVIAAITPTNGALTANTAVSGIMGNMWRVLLTTTGTYAGTTLRIDLVPRGPFGGSAL
jgi:hypothetical protein